MPAMSNLLDRQSWSVRPWPATFPPTPAACAALAILPSLGEVHVMVNPAATKLCTLEHLPGDVERLVESYVLDGPDGGWNPLAGAAGHATFLSPGDVEDLPVSRPTLTPDQLEQALRQSP